jgi:hypothetical protein
MARTDVAINPPVQDAATVPDHATPEPASAHTGFVKNVKFILQTSERCQVIKTQPNIIGLNTFKIILPIIILNKHNPLNKPGAYSIALHFEQPNSR